MFGFGALELEYPGGYVGWVMAYNKLTLKQSGIFATVVTGNQGGAVSTGQRNTLAKSLCWCFEV